MKKYFTFIAYTQNTLMAVSVGMLLSLPFLLAFFPDTFNKPFISLLYTLSHYLLLFVMSIRPLADLLPQNKWVRPLVILRKGAGVGSASIIISFILAKIIVDPSGYFNDFFTLGYWSLYDYSLLAHLADISAFLLLITSNKLSKRILGKGWKRIQKLSYLYFFGSSLFLFLSYNDTLMLYYMIFVSVITLLAFIKNKIKKKAS
jgi:DMSO/TMAO reductase YedYZ heme-binding membrane subunit